mmetsp:Transcript_52095/g.138837  ORF Transcript_52095/g.138837 Transcript_52095/m.138837 type:complete len:331 (-) Transcript_52095:83-1075(-)
MASVVQVVRVLGLCAGYILLSGGLIEFNKFLMSAERFPHAMALTCLHMLTTSILCNMFYWLRPDLYPTMQATEGKRLQVFRWFVPLGLFFAVGLFFSNEAYVYSSPAFLQFMKEGNIVLVFLLSCVLGLQVATRARVVNIVWILGGSLMAVSGQIDFAITGFTYQLISQLGECSKNVMGDWMMKSHLKLDALTYTMFLSPMCLVVLLIGAALTWEAEILTDFAAQWMYLIPNGCLAFTMNVAVSMLIKECSALAFVLAGLVKDAVIVVLGALYMGEIVVEQQYVGFVVCLTGVFFWSYCRVDPHAPAVIYFQRATCSHVEDETLPLVPKV